MPQDSLIGECLVGGTASGRVLHSDVPLSFWGGVDPLTGVVVDKHHPLEGQSLTGNVVMIPSGRGSCSGSGAIFEMLLNNTAPAALVFCHHESILTLGVVIASELFDRQIPVLRVSQADFARLRSMTTVTIVDESIYDGAGPSRVLAVHPSSDDEIAGVTLSEQDQAFLDGALGEAARVAMRIVLRAAKLEGAGELIDVETAHIDGVFYQGPASLRFATTLRDLGAKVRVPTSMNAICVDRQRWRQQGVPSSMGEPSEELADAYEQMGLEPTYTCAPYWLSERPQFGQQIASAESNAVVFSNSVIGARTMKYPDYLDILIAITGRAPNAGSHRDAGRRPTVLIDIEPLQHIDDCLFPVLGYHIGELAPNDIPIIRGLEAYPVSADDLRAFGAGFATTSAAAMFHMVGATPEAPTLEQATDGSPPGKHYVVGSDDLRETWRELNSATELEIDLVSLGNPHFSLTEIARVAELVNGRQKDFRVPFVITCGRDVYRQAHSVGYVKAIQTFGGTFINDTCWCFIEEPIIPPSARNIVTNSSKYAHYGAATLNRGMHLRSLEDCVQAACTGRVDARPPRWLEP
jgi:predicted aconitase/predicted aconitase with swiveling domain